MKHGASLAILVASAIVLASCPDPAPDPFLAGLDVGSGAISPSFSDEVTNYKVHLADDAASVEILAAPADPSVAVEYSVAQPMVLSPGSNPLTITATRAGGESRVYTIDVLREGRFVTEWSIPAGGGSITLPLASSYGSTFDCAVDWGDGTSSAITAVDDPDRTHSYAAPGTYVVTIGGTCEGWQFSGLGDSATLLRRVISWGDGLAFGGFKAVDFKGCAQLAALATGGIKGAGTGITSYYSLFEGCAALGAIPAGLFEFSPDAVGFSYSFRGCAGLTSLPADLFRFTTKGNQFSGTFYQCTGLQELPADLFRYATVASIFNLVFYGCSGLTAIPADIFRYNTVVFEFSSAFAYCSNLASIPVDLFRYNTAAEYFEYVFAGCEAIEALPADPFRYNTSALDFIGAFFGCVALESLPADLFHYNTAATYFNRAFLGCVALRLNSTIFCAPGGEGTRFAGQDMDFSECFYRTSFSGSSGTAPSLWAYTFGSVTSTGCYGGSGNSGSSLDNYASVPAGWK